MWIFGVIGFFAVLGLGYWDYSNKKSGEECNSDVSSISFGISLALFSAYCVIWYMSGGY
jgi:hypothetical protein